MTFNIQAFARLSSSGSNDIITLQDGTLQGAPCLYSYTSAADTIADISAADYFAAQAPVLNVTDLIYVAASDGQTWMTVATVGTNPNSVTVTVVTPGTGDVDGPASSVNNNIAVFNGITGKIIKDGGVSIANLQAGTIIYAADGGATDAYAITLSPVPAAYVTGMQLNFKANTANTGTASLNVNGLGPITIVKAHNQTLATGDIEAGQIVTVVYDGTNFQMQSQTALTLPSGALNTVLQGQGAGSNPAYSTATYPPTTTINGILFSSAANVVGEIAAVNSAVLISDATGVPAYSATMTDGQVIIGSTGATPTAATLTAGTNMSIVNAAGSITLNAGSGTTWNDQTTTPVTLVKNNGYSANNAGLVTLNMPATAAVGDEFTIQGQGAGGWLLRMNTGQTANFGASPTTVAGSLASTNRYDSVKLVCTVADTTFNVLFAVGNLTVA
jgi:hypothetical protein